MDRETKPQPSFGVRFGRALLWLLRLLLVVLIGVAVGVAAYFGGMYVYRQYWEPVPVHAIRLDILEGRQEQTVERLTQQREELLGRVGELELQNDAYKLALDGLRERLAAVETPQADERTRLDAAYAELAQLQASLDQAQPTREALSVALDDLQADLETQHDDLETLQAALDGLERALQEADGERAALQAGMTALSAQVDAAGIRLAEVNEELSGPTAPAALLQELQRLQAMQWLIRARLVLVQNNLALAQVDLLAARRVLVALQAGLPTGEAARIAQVVERLDAALDDLPAAPVAAADELEGAWQLLAGLSSATTSAPAGEAVSTATPTPETTPAPEATPTPTATPRS